MDNTGSTAITSLQDLECLHRYRTLGPGFFSEPAATGMLEPELVCFSADCARLLGLDADTLNHAETLQAFSGNQLPAQFKPIAQDYAGHQFGQFNPMLGDGRALLLAEVAGPEGVMEICLKGAGRTPYSRHADGRAVLRSCLREFIASEAMAGLGIPTTRSLCVTTGKPMVSRQGLEQAGMLVRVSPSHIRFGTFENFFYQSDRKALHRLADFVIEHHFPQHSSETRPYARLFQDIVEATARLIAQWQSVGFTHGVMNTDNLSLLGLTFDYGPFGFMESYQPGFISNQSDDTGLYAFDQQPAVGLWSCNVLARAMSPLVTTDDLKAGLQQYELVFTEQYQQRMRHKLGLSEYLDGDDDLLTDLLAVMADEGCDYTLTLRALAEPDQPLFNSMAGQQWLQRYKKRRQQEAGGDSQVVALMNRLNPLYIPRNHLLQSAIDRALRKDYTEISHLLELFRNPFTAQPDCMHYAQPDREHQHALAVSCSS